MDPELREVFLMQVWIQCRFIRRAYAEMEAAVADLPSIGNRIAARMEATTKPNRTNDQMAWLAEGSAAALEEPIQVWYSIEAILNAAANISKMLWGTKPEHIAPREPLRRALGVTIEWTKQSRYVRNDFEHVDERIDSWWSQSPHHSYVDLSLADGVSILRLRGPLGPEDVFRKYDPATGNVTFWGNIFNLIDLIAEVDRITPLTLQQAHHP